MKVLVISDNPNPHAIGGGDFAVYKYAEGLAGLGHEVVVLGQFKYPFMDRLKSMPGFKVSIRGGIKWKLRGAGKINRVWDQLHTQCLVIPRIRRQAHRPDVILGYQRRSSIKAQMLGAAMGIPVLHFAFEPPTHMLAILGRQYEQVYQGALRKEWDLVRLSYQKSRGLFPLTETVGKEVEEWSGHNVSDPIYAGVECPADTAEACDVGKHILYIGRLDFTKNVHDLIDAMALLKNPPPLIIAGSGYDEGELRERARKIDAPILFKGVVPEKEKWALIKDCRFLVFPSSIEGFGMPPGEALSCCRAAICSDIPVLKEVYGPSVQYFHLHDVPVLAERMQYLLDHPEAAQKMGYEGKRFVKDRYTWSLSAKRLERGIMKALAQ